jgi:DivIVA domain-containing protein
LTAPGPPVTGEVVGTGRRNFGVPVAGRAGICHDREVTQALLVFAVALTVGAVVFGITVLLSSDRQGLRRAEPDSHALPLPADRPLVEPDLPRVRFDTVVRGYRMAHVDAAMQRVAYDIGYKDELIKVLLAEVVALREGRFPDAEVLRRARDAAAAPAPPTTAPEPPTTAPEPPAAAPPPEATPPAPEPPEATPTASLDGELVASPAAAEAMATTDAPGDDGAAGHDSADVGGAEASGAVDPPPAPDADEAVSGDATTSGRR